MDRRGFTGVETIIAIAILVVASGVTAYFAAPAIGKGVNSVWTGTKNQSKQLHKVAEKYTIGRLDEKGKFIKLGDYEKKEELQNLVAQEPPEKWSTKLKILLLIVIVFAIAFPGLAIKAWLKAKANFNQLVTGIEQAKTTLPPEAVDKLKLSLSKKMDASAKAEVKKIVAKIPAEAVK